MGVEAPTATQPPVHRVIKRNASQADLLAARRRIGENFQDVPEEAPFAAVRLVMVDAYLDDLRRLVAVMQITGTW